MTTFQVPKQKTKLVLNWKGNYGYIWNTVDNLAPIKPGVYVLMLKQWDGTLKVFYVGQTCNLDSRLKAHLCTSEPNKCLKGKLSQYNCLFGYAELSSASDRDKAERALYKRYKPVCNDADAIPAVEAVEIVLLLD